MAEEFTPAQALAVLMSWDVPVPPAVRAHLETTAGCPGPGDPRLAHVTNHVVAASQQTPVILSDSLEGESREVGIVLAGIARQGAGTASPRRRPACCSPATRPP